MFWYEQSMIWTLNADVTDTSQHPGLLFDLKLRNPCLQTMHVTIFPSQWMQLHTNGLHFTLVGLSMFYQAHNTTGHCLRYPSKVQD